MPTPPALSASWREKANGSCENCTPNKGPPGALRSPGIEVILDDLAGGARGERIALAGRVRAGKRFRKRGEFAGNEQAFQAADDAAIGADADNGTRTIHAIDGEDVADPIDHRDGCRNVLRRGFLHRLGDDLADIGRGQVRTCAGTQPVQPLSDPPDGGLSGGEVPVELVELLPPPQPASKARPIRHWPILKIPIPPPVASATPACGTGRIIAHAVDRAYRVFSPGGATTAVLPVALSRVNCGKR